MARQKLWMRGIFMSYGKIFQLILLYGCRNLYVAWKSDTLPRKTYVIMADRKQREGKADERNGEK